MLNFDYKHIFKSVPESQPEKAPGVWKEGQENESMWASEQRPRKQAAFP